MESVEKWGVFGVWMRKTVENSVENVEKGLVTGLILGEKSGKAKTKNEEKLAKNKKSGEAA